MSRGIKGTSPVCTRSPKAHPYSRPCIVCKRCRMCCMAESRAKRRKAA